MAIKKIFEKVDDPVHYRKIADLALVSGVWKPAVKESPVDLVLDYLNKNSVEAKPGCALFEKGEYGVFTYIGGKIEDSNKQEKPKEPKGKKKKGEDEQKPREKIRDDLLRKTQVIVAELGAGDPVHYSRIITHGCENGTLDIDKKDWEMAEVMMAHQVNAEIQYDIRNGKTTRFTYIGGKIEDSNKQEKPKESKDKKKEGKDEQKPREKTRDDLLRKTQAIVAELGASDPVHYSRIITHGCEDGTLDIDKKIGRWPRS